MLSSSGNTQGCTCAGTHVSGTSQGPVLLRHSFLSPAGTKLSCGQLALFPVHLQQGKVGGVAVGVQTEAPKGWCQRAGRHGLAAAGMHVCLLQIKSNHAHISATSQMPEDARHTVVAGSNASVGQSTSVPVHLQQAAADVGDKMSCSGCRAARLHRHLKCHAAARTAHACARTHVSATSQMPAEARHLVPAATLASAGQLLSLPLHLRQAATAKGDEMSWCTAIARAGAGMHWRVMNDPHAATCRRTQKGHALHAHISAASQMPAAARHVVPAGW